MPGPEQTGHGKPANSAINCKSFQPIARTPFDRAQSRTKNYSETHPLTSYPMVMLRCISKKTTIPITFPNLQRKTNDGVSSMMSGHCFRVVIYRKTGFLQPRAEIDVFKPDGPETLVEAADAIPHLSRKHEESAGGLLDKPKGHRIIS